MQIIIAWIKKYIFRIESPSALWAGYRYEYDLLKNGNRINNTVMDGVEAFKKCEECKWYGIFTCECPYPCNSVAKEYWEQIKMDGKEPIDE